MNFIKKYAKIVFLFLILLNLIIIASIYFISNKNSLPTVQYKTDLKGYSDLKKSATLLGDKIPENGKPLYSRFIQKLAQVENNKLSQSQKYQLLSDDYFILISLYSNTNDPDVPTLLKEFGQFVKQNFPKEYANSHNYFTYLCQDPTCAQDQQPTEILKIVEDIK